MRRAGAALTLVVTLIVSGATLAAGAEGDDVAAGFIEGREHEVRVRPVLAEVPAAAAKLSRAARATATAAVASCDPAQVAALRRRVPTTPRDGDDPAACVVLATSNKDSERLLLGPAHLTGSELGRATLRRVRRGREQVVVQLSTRGESRWTFISAQVGATELAFTLDGEVLDLAPLGEDTESLAGGLAFILRDGKGFPTPEAERIRELVGQAEREEVIELARQASLSKHGRELFALTEPVIREKTDFGRGCPLPEADDTFLLGCYDLVTDEISILRVDRADVVGVMPVTAAHEMLHAAYERLGRREREKVDTMIEEFLADNPQPRIEESLALYDERDRANEVHSLLGTEVGTLSRPLERYYKRFFDDRAAVVTLFEGYQRVFDDLEARFEQLDGELTTLDAQLRDLEAQLDSASSEAESLYNRIQELRGQGRIDESNALVGAQNAAANRGDALANQYNALVDQYNAKVAEANTIAQGLNDLHTEVSPIEPAV